MCSLPHVPHPPCEREWEILEGVSKRTHHSGYQAGLCAAESLGHNPVLTELTLLQPLLQGLRWSELPSCCLYGQQEYRPHALVVACYTPSGF
ncbi:MAG: hypothetical protein UY95_C0006G0005 [Parcubacteria group bacterium GW2011_GWA2_56_7]|nr:MAG: hypothetical protein UY95_C0006G0005 [Parcubacteria group bacterium GW2011_GWA2_56_7]